MSIEFDKFVSRYKNTTPDYDGSYPGQCVDLYRLYVKEVLKVPQSPAVSGARLIWSTYNPNYFTRIPNSVLAVPRKGDIMIWDAFKGNPYGHVGICVSANLFSFTSFDSNWSIPRRAQLEKHSYRNPRVIGWLRLIETTISDNQIKSLFREIWHRDPAFGDWYYFRKRLELGTIMDYEDLKVKMGFSYGKFQELGDDWWQKEKDKVL